MLWWSYAGLGSPSPNQIESNPLHPNTPHDSTPSFSPPSVPQRSINDLTRPAGPDPAVSSTAKPTLPLQLLSSTRRDAAVHPCPLFSCRVTPVAGPTPSFNTTSPEPGRHRSVPDLGRDLQGAIWGGLFLCFFPIFFLSLALSLQGRLGAANTVRGVLPGHHSVRLSYTVWTLENKACVVCSGGFVPRGCRDHHRRRRLPPEPTASPAGGARPPTSCPSRAFSAATMPNMDPPSSRTRAPETTRPGRRQRGARSARRRQGRGAWPT